MTIRNLVKRHAGREDLPARYQPENELFALQRRMNRMFDDFFGGVGLTPFTELENELATFTPRVDVTESDKNISVMAEMPGIDEKDIEVTLADDTLTLKGEKKEEHEEKKRDGYRLERSFGSFHRVIALPTRVDSSKVRATFKQGVLTVVLPKIESEKAQGRKIEIKAE